MASLDWPHSFTFPRAQILKDGKPVGWAQGITLQVNMEAIPQKAVGDWVPYDIPYVDLDISGSITIARIVKPNSNFFAQGLAPPLDVKAAVSSSLYDLTIVDHPTQQATDSIEGVRFTGFSMQLVRNQVVLHQITFRARFYHIGSQIGGV